MADDTNITSGGGLDRRSLLKKAAVGGALVWVAPTLLSGAAHAQGSGAVGPGFVRGLAPPGTVGVDVSSINGGLRAAVPGFIGQAVLTEGRYELPVDAGFEYWVEFFDETDSICGLVGPVLANPVANMGGCPAT